MKKLKLVKPKKSLELAVNEIVNEIVKNLKEFEGLLT
jgi:hypothetical protein